MPKLRKSEAEAQAVCQKLDSVKNYLSQSQDENFRNMAGTIKDLITGLQNAASESIELLTRDDFNKTLDNYLQLKNASQTYLENHKAEASTQEYKLMQILNAEVNQPVVEQLINAMKIRNEFVDKYKTGGMEEEFTEFAGKYSLGGTRPSIDDCLELSIYNPDQEKTWNQINWLMDIVYKADRIYTNKNKSIYDKTLARIQDEIQDADPEMQMKMTRLLVIRQVTLYDIAHNKYKEFYDAKFDEILPGLLEAEQAKNPDALDIDDKAQEKAREEASNYAHLMLSKSPEYTAALSLNKFMGPFFGSPIPGYAKAMFSLEGDLGPKDLDMHSRPSSDILPLINGGMGHYLAKHNLVETTNEKIASGFEYENFEPMLESIGYNADQDLRDLITDYSEMFADKEHSSGSMTYMRDALKAFISLDHGDALNTPDYENKLNDALRAAREYDASHKGYRITDNGKARQALCRRFITNLESIQAKYNAKKNKDFDISPLTTGDAKTANAIDAMAFEAYQNGFTADEFADKLMAVDLVAKYNFADEYDKARAADSTLPKIDLHIPENEQPARREIYNTARRNMYKVNFERRSMLAIVDKGVKNGDLDPTLARALAEDRDLMLVLMDFGNDPETFSRNMQTARIFAGAGIDATDASKVRHQQAIAKFLDKRINELAQKDYSKYLNLSDRQLAENYVDYQKDMLRISVMQKIVADLAEQNPYITKETVDKTNALVNKYSTQVLYNEERLHVIANPYYINTNTDLISQMSLNQVFALPFAQDSEDTHTQRLVREAGQLHSYKTMSFTDLAKSELVENLSDLDEMNEISFYDEKGNPVDSFSVMDIAQTAGVVGINNRTLMTKCFSCKPGGSVPTAMAPEKFAEAIKKIKPLAKEAHIQHYFEKQLDSYRNRPDAKQDKNYELTWMHTLLGKPELANFEHDFINDCIKTPDPAVGRIRLYEYAMEQIISEANKPEAASPEGKSYQRAIGKCCALLQAQMAYDKYDVPKETKAKLEAAAEKLGKIQADPFDAMKRGEAKDVQKQYTEKLAAAKLQAKAAIEKGDMDAIQKSAGDLIFYSKATKAQYKEILMTGENKLHENIEKIAGQMVKKLGISGMKAMIVRGRDLEEQMQLNYEGQLRTIAEAKEREKKMAEAAKKLRQTNQMAPAANSGDSATVKEEKKNDGPTFVMH